MLPLTTRIFLVKPLLRLSIPLKQSYGRYSTVFKMNKAYFRHAGTSENFDVSFEFYSEQFDIRKQCNMCRRMDEKVETFTKRLGSNIEKVLEKKLRKFKKKKMQSGDTHVTPEVNASILCNNTPVADDFICKTFFESDTNTYSIKFLDTSLEVIVNSPWIHKIQLLTNVMCGYMIYPIKLETFNTDQTRCIWYRSKDLKSWEECGSGFYYETNKQDIDCKLKLVVTPVNKDKIGPDYEIVTDRVITQGPGICPYEKRHEHTKHICDTNQFRVVTYNILADLYADSDDAKNILFSYCSPEALSFNYRRQLLIKEIRGYNADLICLQEVDAKFYKNDLTRLLGFQNLFGIFNEKGGTVSEGLACFYSSKKFKLLSSNDVTLSEELEKSNLYTDMWDKLKNNEKLVERLRGRNTILQMIVLNSLTKEDEIVVVGNTHLYFHPDSDHIRLLQGIICLKQLQHQISQLEKSFPDKKVSLIFCGDFNSVPECGFYQLLTTGNVAEDFIDWQSCPDEEIKKISYSHNMKIASACGTSDYTNFTKEFKACLDYIYYQSDRLEVTRTVPLPSYEEMSEHTAIPSVVFPSDHVPLIADIKWK